MTVFNKSQPIWTDTVDWFYFTILILWKKCMFVIFFFWEDFVLKCIVCVYSKDDNKLPGKSLCIIWLLWILSVNNTKRKIINGIKHNIRFWSILQRCTFFIIFKVNLSVILYKEFHGFDVSEPTCHVQSSLAREVL